MQSKDLALPEFWELREAKDYPGRCYYYNTMTRESTWIHPSKAFSKKNPRPQRYRQILIKHKNSTNPYGRNDTKITRTREEAKAKIKQLRQIIKDDPDSFGSLANNESDTKDSVSNGVIGWLQKDELLSELHSAWNLGVGEISEVLESPIGFHILARDA